MSSDKAALAYESIAAQLAEWGSASGGTGGGALGWSESESMDMDEQEQPQEQLQDEEVETGNVSGIALGAGDGFKLSGSATTASVGGSSFRGALFPETPVAARTTSTGSAYSSASTGRGGGGEPPYSHKKQSSKDQPETEAVITVDTPYISPPGAVQPYHPSTTLSTTREEDLGGRSETFRINQAYHDALRTYLTNHNNNSNKEWTHQPSETYFKQLFQINQSLAFPPNSIPASFTKDDKQKTWPMAQQEANLWMLLRQLLAHDSTKNVASMLYQADLYKEIPYDLQLVLQQEQQEKGKGIMGIGISAKDDPATIVHRALHTSQVSNPRNKQDKTNSTEMQIVTANQTQPQPQQPNPSSKPSTPNTTSSKFLFLLQRRQIMVQWMEGCFARHFHMTPPSSKGGDSTHHNPELLIPPHVAPPKERNVMWPHAALQSRTIGMHTMHPDAPLLAKSSMKPCLGAPNPQDDTLDTELLQTILACLQCGNVEGAKLLCREGGQAWRAVTLEGGRFYGPVKTKEEDGGEVVVKGNPHRNTWKKMCRTIAQKRIKQWRDSLPASMNHSQRASPVPTSVQYEAAMYALLSYSVPLALVNPLLQSWQAFVWVHFRALVERDLQRVLRVHASLCHKALDLGSGGGRRRRKSRFPYPGMNTSPTTLGDTTTTNTMQGETQDEDGSVRTLEEAAIFDAMLLPRTNNTNQTQASVSVEEATHPLHLAMACVIMGTQRLEDYLVQYLHPRALACFPEHLRSDEGMGQEQEGQEQEEEERLAPEVLRCVVHLFIYLSVTFSNQDKDETSPFPGWSLPESSVVDLLRAYITTCLAPPSTSPTLSKSPKHENVSLVALYASLLPTDILVPTYVEFMLPLQEEKERCIALDRAREMFCPGLDLVLLQQVVRTLLDSEVDGEADGMICVGTTQEFVGEENDLEEEGLVPAAGGSGKEEVEHSVMVRASDLKKMMAVRWMCFYPEHRLDALMHANALLRRWLLVGQESLSTSTRWPVGAAPSQKVEACRLFAASFFPLDSVEVVQDYVTSSVAHYEQQQQQQDTGDNSNPTSTDKDLNVLTWTAAEATREYEALCTYLDATMTYEKWTRVMATCRNATPAPPPGEDGNSSNNNNAGGGYAIRHHLFLDFGRAMRSVVRTAIRDTHMVEEKLLAVIRFEQGWLSPRLDTGGRRKEEDEIWSGMQQRMNWTRHDNNNEEEENGAANGAWRDEEIKELRRLCLPHALTMLHSIYDGLAVWMEGVVSSVVQQHRRFYADLEITADDALKTMFQDAVTNLECLDPAFWHRKATSLAGLVAAYDDDLELGSSKTEENETLVGGDVVFRDYILDSMDEEQLELLLVRLAESGVKLLRCTNEKV